MHPRDAEGLEWDGDNEEEFWPHGIRPWEVEQVFLNRPVWAPNKKGRAGDYLMIGETDGGRRLTIPVKPNAATRELRPITGWESSQADLSKYGRGKRGRR
jgi:hypothetical protein